MRHCSMMVGLTGVFGVILVAGVASGADYRENPSQFFTDLLQAGGGYDRLRRPGPADRPTIVTLSMYINKIEEMDLFSETMTLNAYLRYSYTDERLRHGQSSNIVISDPETVQKIWEPDVFVENAQEMDFHQYPTPNVFLRISPSGEVKISRRMQMKVHCDENMQSFPMDTVTCTMPVSTYGSMLDTIRLKGLEPDGTNKGFALAEPNVPIGYAFRGLQVKERETHIPSGSYGVVEVQITMERLRGGYVITTFLPCLGFVILSYLSLFVDTREVGTKLVFNAILLGVTCYLSNSVHALVPRVSFITAMDYYIGTTCLVIFWVMATSVFLDNFSAPDAKLPLFAGPAEVWRWRVELATKFGIPTFYILFQVIFWITYLS